MSARRKVKRRTIACEFEAVPPLIQSVADARDDPSAMIRHKDYYYDCVVIKVQNTLYRIPKACLQNISDIFSDMFLAGRAAEDAQTATLPAGDSSSADAGASVNQAEGLSPREATTPPREGETDEHPIVLEGYLSADFNCLLRIILPRSEDMTGASAKDLMSKAEWRSVLKLATAWRMHAARELAIKKLTELRLPPIEMILIAREYRVPAWLREGVVALAESLQCQETSPEDLAGQIGWVTTARVSWVQRAMAAPAGPNRYRCDRCRADLGNANYCHPCYKPSSILIPQKSPTEIASTIFLEELADLAEY